MLNPLHFAKAAIKLYFFQNALIVILLLMEIVLVHLELHGILIISFAFNVPRLLLQELDFWKRKYL